MDIKTRLTDLAAAASAAGLPAATEKQVNYIIALMARRNISVALFAHQDMLTKRGASHYIDSIPAMNRGLV